MTDQFAYARERGARALLDVLRARRPDLAWEVTIRPVERDDLEGATARAGEVMRLMASGHDSHPLLDGQAAATANPHRAKKAA